MLCRWLFHRLSWNFHGQRSRPLLFASWKRKKSQELQKKELLKIVKILLRSCILISLIKCLKGLWGCSLCSKIKRCLSDQSVSKWQGCLWTAKNSTAPVGLWLFAPVVKSKQNREGLCSNTFAIFVEAVGCRDHPGASNLIENKNLGVKLWKLTKVPLHSVLT